MTTRRLDFVELSMQRIPFGQEYYHQLAYDLDPLGSYRLCPNQRLPHITVNALGYRGKPFTGQEEILVLGDSVTFGVGASHDEERFANFLEAELGVPVADASMRAYRFFQHFGKLPWLLERLPNVKQVLLWGGYLDMIYWILTGRCIEGAFTFEWKYNAAAIKLRASSRFRQAAYYRVKRWSDRLVTTLQGGSSQPTRATGSLEELVASVAMHVAAMHDLCRARGISFTVLLQPFVRSRPQLLALQQLADLSDHKAREKCGRSWYDVAPSFVQELGAALERRGQIHWIDCHSLVDERAFLDLVHLDVGSVHRMAQTLARMPELWTAVTTTRC